MPPVLLTSPDGLPRPPQPARLEWLDALRGFTMVLVVAYHVATKSFGESEKLAASLPLLVLLRMPTFFFVSGFLAYKAGFRWTVPASLSLAWGKVKVQLIPTFVFLFAFIVVRGSGFWHTLGQCMASPTKGGYWFTWVLLQMFVVYYFVCLLAKGRTWAVWLLWVATLFVYETLYMPKVFTYWKAPFFMQTSLFETMKFMHFFVAGNLVRRHWGAVCRAFDSQWFLPLAVALAFVCCADYLRWHCLRMVWANLPRTLGMYALTGLLVMVFRHFADGLGKRTRLGRGLQYIGVRTLDIYLLHYIFLPVMPCVGAWLNANRPNFVLDIILSVGVGWLVIAFCRGVTAVLRINPVLRLYLFVRH